VKASAIFKEIAVTCSLVTMSGVIPSLLEFQYQLKQRIETFSKQLQLDGYSEDVTDALCRLICLVIDLNTRRNLEKQGISWVGYELEHVFYGYGHELLFSAQHAAALAAVDDEEIKLYVTMLSSLSPVPLSLNIPDPRQSCEHIATYSSESTELPEENQFVENAFRSTGIRRRVSSLLIQHFSVGCLLLAVLWLICWYYLTGDMR
jgi:hypothetical protein